VVESFLLAFIPLFVAVDALGIVPIFLSFTRDMSDFEKRRLITQSTLTALSLALVIMILGKVIFSFLGITENDFRVGGGLVLLILAIRDLLDDNADESRNPKAQVGVVPIGVPLIMGPGALTTILMVTDSQGYWMTFASIVINLFIVWVLFSQSKWILKVMGDGGAKAFAKVASLFLAAIAIMMIRVGITHFIR
jgi:multiple antibiotic resistance protein